jgi:hypothetical protein
MNLNLIIGIGSIAALAAGLACVGAHRWAKAHHWPYVPRYVTGVLFAMGAFAFPLFAALDAPDALILFVVLGAIFGTECIFTWLAHDGDPDPPDGRTPEADRLLREIDEELRK